MKTLQKQQFVKIIGFFLLTFAGVSCSYIRALAHTDMYYDRTFGNVKTRILTGFQYEEINKVAIFGQLAEELCKELKFSDLVLLDFIHRYTCGENDCISAPFVSYGKANHWDADSKEWIEKDAIIIIQRAKEFRAQTTLKLLEYAILNLEKIKSTQKQIVFKRGWHEQEVNTIDTLSIKKIIDTPNSDLLNNILKLRIDRPNESLEHGGISYYWQDNRYVVFMKYKHWEWIQQENRWNDQEAVLFDLENIYDFRIFKNWSAIIFDTDTSFYSIKQNAHEVFGSGQHFSNVHQPQISKRHIIENSAGCWLWQPFEIANMGGDRVSISLQCPTGNSYGRMARYRIMLYLADEDILIQDLNELVFDYLNYPACGEHNTQTICFIVEKSINPKKI